MKKVKIGLIGSGAISYTYLKNLRDTFSITEVVGCSDIVEERSKSRAKQFGIRQMTNEEILADPEIEIIVNTTYPLSHFEIQEKAVKAGKHVYSEKMMAENFANAKKLHELAAEKGVRLGMAPDTFLGAGHQTARKLIDSGLIGTPFGAQALVVRGYRLQGESDSDGHPFVFKEGGNIPHDMGGYYINALINLLGPVSRVSGFGRPFKPLRQLNPRHPDYGKELGIKLSSLMTGSLEFENGVLANLTTMSESHLREVPRVEIYGDEGTLIVPDPNTFLGPLYLARGNVSLADSKEIPLTHGYGNVEVPDPGDGFTGEERQWRNSYRGLGVCDMAWAIRNNRAHRCSGDLGLHAMEIIYGIQTSGDSGTVYKMTTKPDRPEALKSGFIYGTASEAVFDT